MCPRCVMRASLWPAVSRFSTGWWMARRPAANSSLIVDEAGGGETYRQWRSAGSCSSRLSPSPPPRTPAQLSWHASRLRRWHILLTELGFTKTPFGKYTEPPPYSPVKLDFSPSKFKMRRNHLFGSIFSVLCWLLSGQAGTHFLKNVCPKLNIFIPNKPNYHGLTDICCFFKKPSCLFSKR